PRVHGITGVSVYDFRNRRRQDSFAGAMPQDLMALTLADVWQLATAGRAVILAQGSIDRAATPLAGHGACQLNGAPVVLARYAQETGNCKPQLFPAACISEGSQRENAVASERGVDGSQN